MYFVRKAFELAFGCVLVWAAAYWMGTAVVALGLAVLALACVGLSLKISNQHTEEFKEMRAHLSNIERNLDRLHDRISD